MPDPATLARQARRALADAHTATLLVEGIGRVAPHPGHVLLADHDGRPRFTCAPGSSIAVAAAARRPAVLDVGVPVGSDVVTGSVIFAGHLALGTGPLATRAAEDNLIVVELQLVSIVVEIDDPASPTVVTCRVPLEVYGANAATLIEVAETMRVHTNTGHANRLRACAAARAGVPLGEILEAQLVEVRADGAVLDWLDTDGGHRAQLGFPRPAGDADELATALRRTLCARPGCC
ncbi:hypothetical protein [uncultured Jatrophihabitans sp.]|uniref:hypothetical protein n=1 Tax=uncultured Jatrophihabitans sp. TaxID=1610747 RepID=UPI0035CCA531